MGTLASLISALASGEAVAAMRRARTAAIVYGLAAVAALCALGFLLGAAYIWVAARYGAMAACLGFAAGFLVLAGLILAIHLLAAGTRARRRARQRNADLKALGITAALALLPSLIKGRGGKELVLGPIIALVAYAIYKENVRPRPEDPEDEMD